MPASQERRIFTIGPGQTLCVLTPIPWTGRASYTIADKTFTATPESGILRIPRGVVHSIKQLPGVAATVRERALPNVTIVLDS